MAGGDEVGTDRYDQWDAAYVLAALDPGERAEYEQHLAGCAACRTRVDTARSTIALLGPPADIADLEAPPVPDTLLPGLLRRASRERRRRHTVVAALGGIAAACLIALVVAVVPGSAGSPSTPRPQAMSAIRQTNVTATAALRPKAWGTEIDVHCRYANADDPGPWSYGLRVVDRSGHTHSAGTWQIQNGQSINFVGGTDVRPDRIARVLVTLPDGTPILQLTL